MITYLKGELIAIEEDKVIIEVGGIGYSVFMPGQSIGMLPQTGNEVKLHTYLNVREDAMQLFGFLTRDDLTIFKLLIGVNGIGPKAGLNILSKMSADDLRYAVLSDDVKAICAAPGIGKKTAEKLIIELKDKLSMDDVLDHISEKEDSSITGGVTTVQSEVIQALVALGYGNTESMKAVKKVDISKKNDVEDVLKEALKYIMF